MARSMINPQTGRPSDFIAELPGDKPSMGDPEFVEGRVRAMLQEITDALAEAPSPPATVTGIVERYAKEFSPDNPDYVQSISTAGLDLFLQSRGFGAGDTEPGKPILALLAYTAGLFVETATGYHEGKLTDEQLAFRLDAYVEDCVALIRGLDNPAD